MFKITIARVLCSRIAAGGLRNSLWMLLEFSCLMRLRVSIFMRGYDINNVIYSRIYVNVNWPPTPNQFKAFI